jgi:hypothetical protein
MPPPKDPKKREDWRRNISNAHLGKLLSNDTRRMISIAHTGVKLSEKTRKAMSVAHTGKKRKSFSEETRRKMSNSHNGVYPSEETRGKLSLWQIGENNSNWNNGSSFEPYPISFNKAFKRFVRNYYGNVCINCGKTPEENGKKLTVHHYDYDKNSKKCVPTCSSCNSIANTNREFWEDWYTEIINEFYNGVCYLPKQQ